MKYNFTWIEIITKKPIDEPNKILLAALVTFLRATKSKIPTNKKTPEIICLLTITISLSFSVGSCISLNLICSGNRKKTIPMNNIVKLDIDNNPLTVIRLTIAYLNNVLYDLKLTKFIY